jgi:hypothetical protein
VSLPLSLLPPSSLSMFCSSLPIPFFSVPAFSEQGESSERKTSEVAQTEAHPCAGKCKHALGWMRTIGAAAMDGEGEARKAALKAEERRTGRRRSNAQRQSKRGRQKQKRKNFKAHTCSDRVVATACTVATVVTAVLICEWDIKETPYAEVGV